MDNPTKQYGLAVPLFSLPGRYGIGDIDSLYSLIDTIKEGPLKVIQLLPLNALNRGEASPYSSISAFANNFLYISLDRLIFAEVNVNGFDLAFIYRCFT